MAVFQRTHEPAFRSLFRRVVQQVGIASLKGDTCEELLAELQNVAPEKRIQYHQLFQVSPLLPPPLPRGRRMFCFCFVSVCTCCLVALCYFLWFLSV